jgi:hypothetical protein
LARNGFAREYRGAVATASACIKRKLRLYPDNIAVRKLISPLESSVIPDRQCGANIHSALRSGFFLRCFGLFKKMNSSLITVVRQKIRRFFKAETAQRTTSIHIPLSRRVLRLFAQFVCHASIKWKIREVLRA